MFFKEIQRGKVLISDLFMVRLKNKVFNNSQKDKPVKHVNR